MNRRQKPRKIRPEKDKKAEKRPVDTKFQAQEEEFDLDPRAYNLIRR